MMGDDPRKLGGDIAGPGGPTDKGVNVIDTTNAVLLGYTTVVYVDEQAADQPGAVGLLMEGRINRTQDHAKVLFLMSLDGAASVCGDIIGLVHRAGLHEEFMQALEVHMKRQP